jgi:hypothetical protein
VTGGLTIVQGAAGRRFPSLLSFPWAGGETPSPPSPYSIHEPAVKEEDGQDVPECEGANLRPAWRQVAEVLKAQAATWRCETALMSWKSRARGKIHKAVQSVKETVRHLTPLERVEILMLILWPIFLLVVFKGCG